ncbi:hypothetical protein [Streptomyces sp. BPTC-684]|uniref:hypothetical protein n=1 Tax=Streptomyces sp. BPTC-684 TaxID=3043734 RepID=UPI0024B1FAFC|nr:hypothetical protein [Streptomyces sp. BPTC-684]WHM41111.1 hypothetical protein QIY60_32475 [Streptomyces sp. BPTC-684]
MRQHTGYDIQAFVPHDQDDGDEYEGAHPAAAAASAAFAAVGFLTVLDCVEDGDPEAAYIALDAAEGFLAHALLGLHTARQSLGWAPPSPV